MKKIQREEESNENEMIMIMKWSNENDISIYSNVTV